VRGDAAARAAIRITASMFLYSSIFTKAIDDIKAVLTGMLAPEVKEADRGSCGGPQRLRSSKFARSPAAW